MASLASTSTSFCLTSWKLDFSRLTLDSFLEVMSASQRVIRSSMSSPASNSSLLTAESVTVSSTRAIGLKCSATSFCTYFIFSFSGIFSCLKMAGTILEPMNSCPWKVHPVPGSYFFVAGLPISCRRAAHLSQRLSDLLATLSRT